MIKRLILTVSLLHCLITQAQVTISVQLPPGGMVQKDQLWNMVVINNNAAINDAAVSLDIQDAVTGQTVLSAVSRNFMLGKGVKVINIKDVQPLQYNYLATELSGINIPLGSYIACYRVIRYDLKGPAPAGDECVRINIAPLSPPLLTTPADKSVLETNYPQFSWLPPTPVDMFSNLRYELLVTEIQPGQSATEAILYNTPVYTNQNLNSPYCNYPATYARLKEGQLYAWQVIVRNGLNYSAQTETWSFTIRQNQQGVPIPATESYLVLKNSTESSGIGYIKSTEELLIKYYSFDNDHTTTMRLLSADGKLLKEVKQKIVYGNNLLRLKTGQAFKKGEQYRVEITDQQNKIYSAVFIISEPE